MSSALRNIYNVLLRATRFQIAVLIRKAHDRIDVAHINPLRSGPQRIKRNSVRPLKSRRESLQLLRLAVRRDSAKNFDISWIAFRHEEIAVRRGHYQPRI